MILELFNTVWSLWSQIPFKFKLEYESETDLEIKWHLQQYLNSSLDWEYKVGLQLRLHGRFKFNSIRFLLSSSSTPSAPPFFCSGFESFFILLSKVTRVYIHSSVYKSVKHAIVIFPIFSSNWKICSRSIEIHMYKCTVGSQYLQACSNWAHRNIIQGRQIPNFSVACLSCSACRHHCSLLHYAYLSHNQT